MQFQLPSIIESERLLLRQPTLEDASSLFHAMLGDAETTRFLSFRRHRSIAETSTFIEQAQREVASGARGSWVIVDKASDALVGMIDMAVSLPRVEVGVMISRRGGVRRRRDGLAVLRKVLDWLLDQPPVWRLTATCAVNGAAHAAMERLGFVREAVLVNYAAQPNLGLEAVDHYLFARTRTTSAAETVDNLACATRWIDAVLDEDLAQMLASVPPPAMPTARAPASTRPLPESPTAAQISLDDICGFDDEGMPIFHSPGARALERSTAST